MVKYKKPEMEVSFQPGKYKEDEIEDLYEMRAEREERPIFQEEPLPEERVVREVEVSRQAMPHMDEQVIKPLKLLGEDVIGSLFDRVAFLKKRIEEIREALKTRERLHEEMVAEIGVDVKEKEQMVSKLADVNERRNLKLDISILRKEKRLEHVQFWRDVTELRSELRELLEKYETEIKIVDIFKTITPTGVMGEGEQA